MVVRLTSDVTDLFPVSLLQVKKDELDFGWGVVVNFSKKSNVKVGFIHFTLYGQVRVDTLNLFNEN